MTNKGRKAAGDVDAKKPTTCGALQTQSERFIAKARELGLDEREETFDAALTKVVKRQPKAAIGAPRRDPIKPA